MSHPLLQTPNNADWNEGTPDECKKHHMAEPEVQRIRSYSISQDIWSPQRELNTVASRVVLGWQKWRWQWRELD